MLFLLPMGEGGGAEPRRMRVGCILRRKPSQGCRTQLALTSRAAPHPFSRKDDGFVVVRSSPLPSGEGGMKKGRLRGLPFIISTLSESLSLHSTRPPAP